MPSRRLLLPVAGLAVCLVLAGCSGDDPDPGRTPTATVAPTAAGDAPLVQLLGPGGGAASRLTLDLTDPAPGAASLVVRQRIDRDGTALTLPPVTYPFDVAVAPGDGTGADVALTFDRPTIDGTGLRPADVATVRSALAPIVGTSSTLVVRDDGSVASVASDNDAADQVDGQLQSLLPVLSSVEVGVGASWTATSVLEVDGATVDQVATYTLESLEGRDYVIGLSAEQTYRPGPVDDVTVQSGGGTVTARLVGSLDRPLPEQADGSISTQVSYVVGNTVTQVQTSVTLGLTSR